MSVKPVEIEILMKDRLTSGLDKAGRKVDELKVKTSSATSEMERLDRQAQSVKNTASKIAGAFAVQQLVQNIIKVRGEFQQLEVSFNTMLGSEEKASELMDQLIRTAATTPFDLQGIANGARQLLAYGENVENVNDDLIRLGNIAAGLNQPLNDLVYLYGTTMTQGRLYTQDYNQFVGRGIPLGRELANVLGVAESKVREMVEAGKVGFPEVQKALQNLTNEGGMFYNLMEEQSKTITGQISNIEDSISTMFNEIGNRSEGIINRSLSGVSYLIEHYEQVGRVLVGLVSTYGVYKTAVMAVTAMQALQTAGVGALTTAETIHYGWLVLVEKAQKMLNATMLANPYVLVATLIAGIVAAMTSMKNEEERLREAEEDYQAAKQKTIEAEEEHRRKMEELCSVAGDESLATDTRREALNRLEQKYPDIFAKYDTEYEKLKNIKRIKEEIAALEAGSSITKTENELNQVNARIKELEAKKATERWEDANGSGTRMRKVGGLSSSEESELKNLQNKRKTLSAQARKESVNAYFENLTGVSNDTLAQQIKQRENLLALMSVQEKKYGKITYGDGRLTGTYSRDELQYQEALRKRLVLAQAGANYVGGLVGNITLIEGAGVSVSWEGENDEVADSKKAFSTRNASPKRCAVSVPISKQLALQSSFDVDTIILNDIYAAHAEGLETAALVGTGSDGQPTGLLNTSGIGSVDLGTNGAKPTWANIVDLETQIALKNADLGRLSYLTNPKVRGLLKTTLKADGVPGFIWERNEVNGYPIFASNVVPSDLTKGTASKTCSAILFGDWSQLWIMSWGGLDIVVDPYTLKKSGAYEVTLNAYHDIFVRRKEAFAAIKDALTA